MGANSRHTVFDGTPNQVRAINVRSKIMAAYSGNAFNHKNTRSRYPSPLRNCLRADPAKRLRQKRRPSTRNYCLFANIFHADMESIAFNNVQAFLSMKVSLSWGILNS